MTALSRWVFTCMTSKQLTCVMAACTQTLGTRSRGQARRARRARASCPPGRGATATARSRICLAAPWGSPGLLHMQFDACAESRCGRLAHGAQQRCRSCSVRALGYCTRLARAPTVDCQVVRGAMQPRGSGYGAIRPNQIAVQWPLHRCDGAYHPSSDLILWECHIRRSRRCSRCGLTSRAFLDFSKAFVKATDEDVDIMARDSHSSRCREICAWIVVTVRPEPSEGDPAD